MKDQAFSSESGRFILCGAQRGISPNSGAIVEEPRKESFDKLEDFCAAHHAFDMRFRSICSAAFDEGFRAALLDHGDRSLLRGGRYR